MKIIIIEDESITALDLEKTIKAVDPQIEVTAILESIEDAISFLKNNDEHDLIFSDIQLGNKLSFEIFREVKTTAPIIFCTAYNEYALDAFRANGIDYILKPYSKETIHNAIKKYQNLKERLSQSSSNLNSILAAIEKKLTQKQTSLLIRRGDKILPLELNAIALFYIEDEYTYAWGFDQKNYPLSETLETLEAKYAPRFFRVNRQILINRKAVKEASHYFDRKIRVTLTIPFKQEIIISKLRVPAFTSWLTSH